MISAFGVHDTRDEVSKIRIGGGEPLKLGQAAAKVAVKLRPLGTRARSKDGLQAFIRSPRKDKA